MTFQEMIEYEKEEARQEALKEELKLLKKI
jgi:hypothetical protein